jgi:formyltetrahydrofolate deformylase
MQQQARSKFACLRIHGPDQKGILAAYSQLLDQFGCAIMKSEQFTDPKLNHYYQRSIFHPSIRAEEFSCGSMDDNIGFHVEEKLEIKSEMVKLKDRFGLEMMKVNWRDRPKRMAIFVSKYDHCLVRRIELERYVEYFAP